MRADTIYSVEVLPNTVKYYGVEVELFHNGEEPIVKIPLTQLKELMEFASENHEYVVSATIHNGQKFASDEDCDKFLEETFELIDTILQKTRG